MTPPPLAGNLFEFLPPRIVGFPKLKKLDIANGRLEYIPGVVSRMSAEIVVHLSPALQIPPIDVQKKGSRAVKEHLAMASLWWNPRRVTVVVLGAPPGSERRNAPHRALIAWRRAQRVGQDITRARAECAVAGAAGADGQARKGAAGASLILLLAL